jgi:putative transposase
MAQRPPTQALILSDTSTREFAIERLKAHIQLQASGYSCTTDQVFDVLIRAAVTHQTIETVCQELQEMVDGETIRGYLNEQIKANDLLGLEQQVNQALVVGIPRRLWKARIEVAIDLHDEPFYGHSADLLAYTCRGEATKGTTRFFRLATAYVIFKDMRLTLALLFVKPGDNLPDIVAALLRRLRHLEFKVRRLYLDKGFCTIPILRYLAEQKWPAILACPIRGKRGGTRALCQGHRSYLTEHTFKSQPHGAYTVPVAVVRTLTSHKRRKHGSRRVQWLVFVLLNSKVSARLARKLYRRRFGIETSYRCMRQVRAWTTSRNAALRFFLLSLGFLLVNLWVELRWRFCQIKCQGRRQLDLNRFRLQRMVGFLNRAIERLYAVVSFIVAEVPPLGV